jgi:tetratricopeptide (TPR) repeat protein
MSESLAATRPPTVLSTRSFPAPSLSVPWRDPHAVPPTELAAYIGALEQACLDDPRSADLRTVLGMAYAVNYDVPKSMEALEVAVSLDPDNFWASLKYAELHYRLRALNRAEELTTTALNLATNGWQLSLARKQLQEVRTLKRNSTRNLSWKMPIAGPLVALSATLLAVAVAFMWR